MLKWVGRLVAIIPAALALPIIVITVLGVDFDFLPENSVELLSLACLAGIATSILFLDPSELSERFDTLNHKISDVFLFSRGNMAAVRPARASSIWVGFKGTLYALNPPLIMVRSSDDSYEQMVQSHAARLADPDFRVAHYVFFRHGEKGRHFPQALPDFVSFYTDIFKVVPDKKRKLRVTVSDSPAPGFTYFCGEKAITSKTGTDRVSYSITYINEKPLVLENGFPSWSFISLDEEYNSTLETHCLEFINAAETLDFDDLKKRFDRGDFSSTEKSATS